MPRWSIAVPLLAACAGCGLGDGTGTFAGTLYVRSCTSESDFGASGAPAAYNMNPSFFVADPIDAPTGEFHPVNRLEMRIQATGNREVEADLLFVNVADDMLVAQALGQPLPLGPATNVRASLALNRTCPQAESGSELDGTITFSAFGAAGSGALAPDFHIEFGDRLAATLQVTVVDRRTIALGGVGPVSTVPATSGQLAGGFDFIVHQGKTAQPF
jgi:hypothetical protein